MKLRTKLFIIIGAVIASLFILIFCFGYFRWQKIEAVALKSNVISNHLDSIHDALQRTIALTTMGEEISNWDAEKLQQYHSKRLATDSLLTSLKAFCPPQSIDSICMALESKERFLAIISECVTRMSENDDNLTTDKELTLHDTHTKVETVAGNLFHKRRESVQSYTTKRTVHVSAVDEAVLNENKQHVQNIGDYTDSITEVNYTLNHHIGILMKSASVNAKDIQCSNSQAKAIGSTTFNWGMTLLLFVLTLLAFISFWWARIMDGLEQKIRQVRELMESRRTIVYSIVHELKAPISSLTAYPELIRNAGSQEETNGYADDMTETVSNMSTMVDSLLCYFKADSDKLSFSSAPFKLISIKEYLFSTYGRMADSKGLHLDVNVYDDTVLAGDEQCIQIILGNLVSNAVKFTETGKITVDMMYEGNILSLSVRDEGDGISDEDKQRIFEPFTQLSNAAAQEGFGLGLSIVSTIVRKMGGSIAVSDNGDKGTVFNVSIPVRKAEDVEDKCKKVCKSTASYSVLIIDNDKNVLSVAKAVFANVGAACDTCTDVAQMMELMEKRNYDVVITDLKMPGANGYDVLMLLKTSDVGNCKDVPVIVSTMTSLITEEELIKRGFSGCLIKPYTAKELVDCVESHITVRPVEVEPDLSSLLTIGEEPKILQTLIDETKAAKERLKKAGADNTKELCSILHHLMPTWMKIRSEKPLRDLYLYLNSDEGFSKDKLEKLVDAIQRQCDTIICLAEKRKEEIA